jgi:hypothetical protein
MLFVAFIQKHFPLQYAYIKSRQKMQVNFVGLIDIKINCQNIYVVYFRKTLKDVQYCNSFVLTEVCCCTIWLSYRRNFRDGFSSPPPLPPQF